FCLIGLTPLYLTSLSRVNRVVSLAGAYSHVGEIQDGDLDIVKRLTVALGIIHVGDIADDVLRGYLSGYGRYGAENAAGDLRCVSARSYFEGVVSFVGRRGEVAGNILVKIIQRIHDPAAGLFGEACQVVGARAGEAE